jgi:hypothetical protein
MSKLYDAMKQMERERQGGEQLPGQVPQVLETLSRVAVERGNFEKGQSRCFPCLRCITAGGAN